VRPLLRGGCGSGPYYRQCTLWQTIRDTYETGVSHYQVEVSLSHYIDNKKQNATFLISTTRIVIKESPLVLLSLQDITEHRKLEEQFRRAQKMGNRSPAIAKCSHNLRPVNVQQCSRGAQAGRRAVGAGSKPAPLCMAV
jgi:hypothetical protein